MAEWAADQLTVLTKATLVEQELISSESWLIGIRWLAGAGVLAATWLATSVLGLALLAVPLYVIGLAILAYNAVLGFVLDRQMRVKPRAVAPFMRIAVAQIGLDWLAMILLIHYSGGVASPAIL